MTVWWLPIAGYLLGSISFSVLIVRLITGEDVRTLGSGNAGATNVLRSAGKLAALGTLIGDVGKGVAAVLLARAFDAGAIVVAATALAAVLGHVFPVFFGFRGGKGVATATGVFLTLAPIPTLTVVPIFVGLVVSTRYVSLGSVGAAFLLPVSLSFYHGPLGSWGFAPTAPAVLASAIAGAVVIFKHQENIRRLICGTERKLGEPDPP